jgi:hypothetical protein
MKSEKESLKAERLLGEGERELLASVVAFVRSLRRNPNPKLAQAAREWDGAFCFRIQMTLQERRRRAISSRSTGHIQRGVSPVRG